MQQGRQPPPDIHALVEQKLARVFDAARGAEILAIALTDLSLARVDTVDDLARMADWLKGRGGFEATVGTILAVQVMLRRSSALTNAISTRGGRT